MSLARSFPLQRSLRPQASRCCRHGHRPPQWSRSARRGYASEGGGQSSPKKSMFAGELPWLITSLAVTIPGTYFILNSGPKGAILKHPMPGDHYHGDDGEEHGEDEEGEAEDGEGEGESEEDESSSETDSANTSEKSEAESNTSVEDSGEQQNEESAANADPQDAAAADSSSSNKTTGKRLSEQPTDNVMKKKNSQGEEGLPWDQRHELEKGPQGQTRLHYPDSKGGAKKRVESAKGIVQGRAEGQEEGESIGDVKDGSKSAVAGQTPAQQKGLSNTDTKHSTDLMKDPEKSKKSEGVPETAKIQGTVQPGRKPS